MSELRECPFCGNPVEHESTITEEVIRCSMCPAKMVYDGSYAALFAMWNARPTPPDIMDVEKVMDTYDEYVALLQDELNDVVLLAHSRGWRSTRYDAGAELREKITLLKAALSDSTGEG